jgi:hypothetical protein
MPTCGVSALHDPAMTVKLYHVIYDVYVPWGFAVEVMEQRIISSF